jgi:hypothetical protein
MVRFRTVEARLQREMQIAALGKALRAQFADVEGDPLPDRLRELLDRLGCGYHTDQATSR